MAFKIPSLKEARQKQEKTAAAARINQVPRTGIGVTPRSVTTTPSRIVNPYTKTKKTTSTTISNAPPVTNASQIVSKISTNEKRSFVVSKKTSTVGTNESNASSGVSTGTDINTDISSNTSLTPRENHAQLQHNKIHVSTKQRGNKLLKYLQNPATLYQFSKITPDYILSTNRCALFLSIKYHNLHPHYIHRRIKELGRDFDLRLLLLLVDVEDNASVLHYLNKIAVVNNLTLILAWSNEEAARYIETYKLLENNDAAGIKKRETSNHLERVTDVLTAVKSVNRTDCATLMSEFKDLRSLCRASAVDLERCPGFGETKVRRLYDGLHERFSNLKRSKEVQEMVREEQEGEEEYEFEDEL